MGRLVSAGMREQISLFPSSFSSSSLSFPAVVPVEPGRTSDSGFAFQVGGSKRFKMAAPDLSGD